MFYWSNILNRKSFSGELSQYLTWNFGVESQNLAIFDPFYASKFKSDQKINNTQWLHRQKSLSCRMSKAELHKCGHTTNDGHLPTSCFPCNLWILDKQAWNRLLEKYTVRMWDKQQIYWSASNEWGCLRISANVATKIWSR